EALTFTQIEDSRQSCVERPRVRALDRVAAEISEWTAQIRKCKRCRVEVIGKGSGTVAVGAGENLASALNRSTRVAGLCAVQCAVAARENRQPAAGRVPIDSRQ